MKNNLIYSAGYVKDSIASVIFALVFILLPKLKDLNKVKELILISVIIGFIIDFSYTLNPEYHFVEIGYNTPTYILIFGIILNSFALYKYRKHFLG